MKIITDQHPRIGDLHRRNTHRRLIFGKGYRNRYSSRGKRKGSSDNITSGLPAISDSSNLTESESDTEASIRSDEPVSTEDETGSAAEKEAVTTRGKGHGRMSHTVYKDCDEETIASDYALGALCPTGCGGKLGRYPSGIFVRIFGQNFAKVKRYSIEKLRCCLCGYIVLPEAVKGLGKEKYDATFKSMLALQKYFVAVPFYRQAYFQQQLSFPLPDSTQWDLIESLASACYAPFDVLKTQAANSKLMHLDDTRVRILSEIQRFKSAAPGDRTGMFTTGFICEYGEHKIALFMNGTQHAGENLDGLLSRRDSALLAIIQMCDGLSQNISKKFPTILCHCLSHGFRKFEELQGHFPEECLRVMHLIGQLYDNNAATVSMTDEERLAYHQTHSQPVVDTLKAYLDGLLDERHVEPNSELGGAITYMRKRWASLTRFLSVAGAPIDNNVVERALKIAIRNRKSAMFYKTEYSAQIGGMITSLIYTCILADENPYDYLTALQRHQRLVSENPAMWLPWNYQQTQQDLGPSPPFSRNGANHQGLSSSEDCLAAA